MTEQLTPDQKKEKVIEFVKAMNAIEDEILPLRESLKALKENFIENNWISKDEMKSLLHAWRFFKKHENLEQVTELYDKLTAEFGPAT